ncbi:MAG: RagB/SusD family nutrient uptake outer membrane protein [Rikenellaceae bacterium]
MKKNIFKLMALALTIFINTSCEDMFDYENELQFDIDEVFSDYYMTGAFVNTCYASLPNYSATSVSGTFIGTCTDEAQSVSKSNIYNDYYDGAMSSSNDVVSSDHINDLYEGIRNCNIFLENIDNLEYYVVPEYKSQWIGEIYVMRAFYAWSIVKRYGPMPIEREVILSDYDYSTLTKPSFYECVQDIIADCDLGLAEEGLKWRNDISLETMQKVITRAAAYAIKSQAILFAASPLWNTEDDPALWAEAVEITGESLEMVLANDYELYEVIVDGDGQDKITAYQDLFLRSFGDVSNVTNKEILMVGGSTNNLWKNYGVPIYVDGGESVNSCGLSPTQELADAYDTAQGNTVLDLSFPYSDASHLQPNYNSAALSESGDNAFDINNPYANRDPRMAATMFRNEDYRNLTDNTEPVYTYSGGNSGINVSDTRYTQTGYYLRKFIRWTSTSTDNTDGTWSYFRLAELYLNYAEAVLESGGDVQTVLDNINVVRTRADQMPALTITDRDELRRRLRNERRVEFAFEEHRYFDLRRWMENQNYEGVATGVNINSSNPTSESNYERFALKTRKVTDDKYRLWPLSLEDEQKYQYYGVDLQNPGW